MLSYDVKLCQWSAREILAQNSRQIAKKNNLTDLSLLVDYVTGIGNDKGDDHHHHDFYAKRVLIVAFPDVHIKD